MAKGQEGNERREWRSWKHARVDTSTLPPEEEEEEEGRGSDIDSAEERGRWAVSRPWWVARL